MEGLYYSEQVSMDCHLPVTDGFDASRKIRQYDPNTTIIAVTANALKSEERSELMRG